MLSQRRSKDDLYCAKAWLLNNEDRESFGCDVLHEIIDLAIAEAEDDTYPQAHYDEMKAIDAAVRCCNHAD